MRNYFVSYLWHSARQSGSGYLNVSMTLPVRSIKDVHEMREWILKNAKDGHFEPVTAVTITNYIEFKRPWHERFCPARGGKP